MHFPKAPLWSMFYCPFGSQTSWINICRTEIRDLNNHRKFNTHRKVDRDWCQWCDWPDGTPFSSSMTIHLYMGTVSNTDAFWRYFSKWVPIEKCGCFFDDSFLSLSHCKWPLKKAFPNALAGRIASAKRCCLKNAVWKMLFGKCCLKNAFDHAVYLIDELDCVDTKKFLGLNVTNQALPCGYKRQSKSGLWQKILFCNV